MNLLQNIIYGLVSGLSEFLPVSSFGHQVMMRNLFGVSQWDPVRDLFVHLALCFMLFFTLHGVIDGYRKELSGTRYRNRRRHGYTDQRRTYEIRLLIVSAISMLIMLLFTAAARGIADNPLLICLFFILNGIVLFLPDYMRQTNKDASMLSGFDGLLMGVASGLRIFPGFSGFGLGLSVAVFRGADKKQALNWMLVLCIPALLMLCVFDLIGIFTVSELSVTFLSFLGYLLAAISAAVSGYFTIVLMRFLISHTGFGGYACYCWGMAIMTFIIYLIS